MYITTHKLIYSHIILRYISFGFRVLREVGEDSVADRLVWGATGTLMAMDIPAFFTEWTPKTRAMLASMSTAQDSKQL